MSTLTDSNSDQAPSGPGRSMRTRHIHVNAALSPRHRLIIARLVVDGS